MEWRHPGDKPLSGQMVVSLLWYACVTRPQCVKLKYSLKVENKTNEN